MKAWASYPIPHPAALVLAFWAVTVATEACTAAQLSAFDQDIAKGQAALVPAENLACTTAAALDPSGATAICSAVDTTGAVVGAAFTVIEDAASIAQLVQVAAPKSAAVTEALHTAMAAKKAAKK
jgi:hypothetical protein